MRNMLLISKNGIPPLFKSGSGASPQGEANSIGSMITDDAEPTRALVTSTDGVAEGVTPQNGSYFIKVEGTAIYGRAAIILPVIAGKHYDVSIWARRMLGSTDQRFIAWLGFTVEPATQQIDNSASWQEYTWTNLEASATGNATIRIYACQTGYVAGLTEVYFDNVVITQTD